jgi:phenylacetate-CoA ligase
MEHRIFQPEIETMCRAGIEALQLERLKSVAIRCYERVPMYKKKFDDARFDPYKIKVLSDIEYMPFTTKEDFRDNYPFGMFAVPKKDILRLHASSGTTGKPTVVGYTRKDLDVWSDCIARIVTAAGATDEDTIQISFGYGLFTGALGLHYGLEKIGACVVPASSGNTQKQIMLLKDCEATGIVATPSYAMHIGDVIKEMGYDIEKDFTLKWGILGSEGCTEEMRDQIEKSMHIFVTDNYGMSELMGPGVSGECMERKGLHFNEDHFLPEIIDPATLTPLKPNGDGSTARGELVVTTLSKDALPVLRYRTKDITRFNYSPCACGRTHIRMDKASGRTDDMLKIRGVNVFPSQIESVVMTFSQIAPHYELVVTRSGGSDRLEVRVELIDGSLLDSYAKLEQLREHIRRELLSVLGINVKVSLVEPKSLKRFEGKAKRVVDNR